MYEKLQPNGVVEAHIENMEPGLPKNLELICFARKTWEAEMPATQALLSQFAGDRRVFFLEEPILEDKITPYYHINVRYTNKNNVIVIVPHLIRQDPTPYLTMIDLVNRFIQEFKIEKYILWYCTPLPLRYSFQLKPELVVYDSTSQQSIAAEMKTLETELLVWSDVVVSTNPGNKYELNDWNAVNQLITTAFLKKGDRIIPRPFDQIEWHEVQLTSMEL